MLFMATTAFYEGIRWVCRNEPRTRTVGQSQTSSNNQDQDGFLLVYIQR